MSVVGFDFGNDTCVIAVARKRVIDVLQNSAGHRKTPTMVAFAHNQRMVGNDAEAQRSGNFKNTICFMKRFLGRQHDEKELAEELKFVPFQITRLDNGGIGFPVQYNDEDTVVSVPLVTAAMFTRLKRIAESGLEGLRVSDCVISCPPFWVDSQRRALLDSARLAGLNVLRIMNEPTAVALNYGILRPLPADTTQHVCFVDVGYASTNVALVAFKQGALRVLAHASDPNLGARNFDMLLMKHFAADIKERYKLDVWTKPKSILKLAKECAKVKKTLSANTSVPFTVEYIMNDTDVKGQITRDEFEKMAAVELLPRLTKPIDRAFELSGVAKDALHSVEVVGGGHRIPCVQRALQEYFGKDLSKTCDGDESVARGCALMCAMLSPNFKVREFEVQDIQPFAINVQWGNTPAPDAAFEAEGEPQQLISVGNPIPCVKMMTFNNRTAPMTIVADYKDKDAIPAGINPLIGTFTISGMPPGSEDAVKPPRMKVKLRLDLHGTLSVSSAQWLEEVKLPEAETAPAAEADAPKAMDTDGAAAAAAAAGDGAEAKETAEPMDAEPSPSADSASETPTADAKDSGSKAEKDNKAPAAAETAAEEPKKKKKKTSKTNRQDLVVESFTSGTMPQSTFDKEFEREASMAAQDTLVEETHERRNALETYVLETRTKMEGELREFATDEVRSKFVEELNGCEEWLDDEGYDAQKSEYIKRLDALRAIGGPVFARKYELENRDSFIGALKSTIVKFQVFAASTDAKFAHIKPEEKEKVLKECNEADQWLTQVQIKQDQLAKHDDPAVTCTELEAKRRAIEALCQPIVDTPKPKPKPKPEKKKEEKKDGAAAEGKDATPATEKMDTDGSTPDAAPADAGAEAQPAEKQEGDAASSTPMDVDGAASATS